ncbi:trichoplein keratin filament-binding protein family member [Holotrichia oblita]|uniref:Trichoplein keratin filament-binding protein family member n=3 Tax=Holotrichia oblita TaxID=644536 RepID=A0ACB9TL21_HOLOL|nr:trichoplein keratin filament-binding protein family member [Holotrichia oblita]
MFGGSDPPIKPKPKPKLSSEFRDILNPSVHPGLFAHYGREPNTDYKVRLMLYKQRIAAMDREGMSAESQRLKNEYYRRKFQFKTDLKWDRLNIRNQVNQKMKEYDEELDKKRERLRELLAKEEREEVRETVDNLQKGEDLKYEEMKLKARKIAAEKEAERLKVVEAKRIQQYADRCEDLRPALAKKHLLESKIIQLQQIRENESRRQSEKEWDSMWEDAMNKNIMAKIEREEQDCLDEYRRRQEDCEILRNQMRGKELAKLEELKTREEDRLEMIKLSEKMRTEQIEEMKAIQIRKVEMAEELRKQIQFQERVLADRQAEEKKLDDAFIYLSQLEYEKELIKAKDTTSIAKRETMQNHQHLRELEQQRKRDEKRLDELLELHRKAIEKKQDEARCKVLEAKEKLLHEVIAGRDEQIQYKKQIAEEQLKTKQQENEICKLTYETNKKLCEEASRLRAEAAKQYRDDLCRQIDYNNMLRQREQADLERKMEIGRQEEEKYRKMVEGFLAHDFDIGEKHPFRQVLEQYDCHCNKLNPKY